MKVHLRIHKTVLSSDRHCYSDENRKMWHIIDDAHMLPKACFMWPASVMQPTHLICLYANQLPRFIREISKWKCMAPRLQGSKVWNIEFCRWGPLLTLLLSTPLVNQNSRGENAGKERRKEGRRREGGYHARAHHVAWHGDGGRGRNKGISGAPKNKTRPNDLLVSCIN